MPGLMGKSNWKKAGLAKLKLCGHNSSILLDCKLLAMRDYSLFIFVSPKVVTSRHSYFKGHRCGFPDSVEYTQPIRCMKVLEINNSVSGNWRRFNN